MNLLQNISLIGIKSDELKPISLLSIFNKNSDMSNHNFKNLIVSESKNDEKFKEIAKSISNNSTDIQKNIYEDIMQINPLKADPKLRKFHQGFYIKEFTNDLK